MDDVIQDYTVEALAAYAHEAWSGWMEYMFKKSFLLSDGSVKIPAGLANRWRRQMFTLYDILPENEKESDREEARRMLKIIMERNNLKKKE